jgi:hypothetical protein
MERRRVMVFFIKEMGADMKVAGGIINLMALEYLCMEIRSLILENIK